MFQEHQGRKPLADLGCPSTPPSAPLTPSPDGQPLPVATTAYSLERILGLLELLGFEIDRFMWLHTLPDDTDDEVALSWMHTALEDMSATLVGMSTHPHHRDEA